MKFTFQRLARVFMPVGRPKNYCGRLETMGHGDNAKCGEKYWGEIFQCKDCQIKDLKGIK